LTPSGHRPGGFLPYLATDAAMICKFNVRVLRNRNACRRQDYWAFIFDHKRTIKKSSAKEATLIAVQ
jgi:hypothetical protein